jgi:hypothetical protein
VRRLGVGPHQLLPDTQGDDFSSYFSGLLSYFGQVGLTVSAKFLTAAKVSLYRKSFDILFAVFFQISLFEVPQKHMARSAALQPQFFI